MTEPAANETAAALSAGARLAQARERLGLSQEHVADKLKLDSYTIAALEAGDYRVIGAAVFVRGFLRRYAQLVGDSPAEIEALYARQPESAQAPDLARVRVRAERAHRPRKAIGLWPAALGVALLCAGGIWWWSSHRTVPQRADATFEIVATAPPAAPVTSTAPGAPIAPAASAAPSIGAAIAPAPAADAEAAALAARLAGLPRKHLTLRVNDECWIEAYDARGVRLQFGFAHAGSSMDLIGTPPFRLVLGNAGAVEVAVDGVAVSLPVPAPGARLRVTISGKGVPSLHP